MTEALKYAIEHLWSIVIGLAVPVLLWRFRDWKPVGARTAEALTKHIEDCNRVPKVLLLEKIDNVSQQFETYQATASEFRTDVREALRDLQARAMRVP